MTWISKKQACRLAAITHEELEGKVRAGLVRIRTCAKYVVVGGELIPEQPRKKHIALGDNIFFEVLQDGTVRITKLASYEDYEEIDDLEGERILELCIDISPKHWNQILEYLNK